MKNRLEELRKELDRIMADNEPDKIRIYALHINGVSKFCNLLAEKRNLNTELATACGILHDIEYMAGGSSENHAVKGAKRAETLLKEMNAFNDEEIKIITTAIANHSDKRTIHDDYDELLKDADLMDHCFYSNDFSITQWKLDRYNNLLKELGIS